VVGCCSVLAGEPGRARSPEAGRVGRENTGRRVTSGPEVSAAGRRGGKRDVTASSEEGGDGRRRGKGGRLGMLRRVVVVVVVVVVVSAVVGAAVVVVVLVDGSGLGLTAEALSSTLATSASSPPGKIAFSSVLKPGRALSGSVSAGASPAGTGEAGGAGRALKSGAAIS